MAASNVMLPQQSLGILLRQFPFSSVFRGFFQR